MGAHRKARGSHAVQCNDYVASRMKRCGLGVVVLGVFQLLLVPYAMFILPPLGKRRVSPTEIMAMVALNALFVPFIVIVALKVRQGTWLIGAITLSLLLAIGAGVRLILLGISPTSVTWLYYIYDSAYFITALFVFVYAACLLNMMEDHKIGAQAHD